MNSFGRLFSIELFGGSHAESVGITIRGCPKGIKVTHEDFRKDLIRRKSGAKGTTERKETDEPQILSGIENDFTTGENITIVFKNEDIRSTDYKFRHHPRPGHADFTANRKYKSLNDDRGGGIFSGRMTVGLVAAGVIAKKICSPIELKAKVLEVGGSTDISKKVEQALELGDSFGGLIECIAYQLPVGLGEPFFDSVESLISHVIFSIPGIKGIEFGSGFRAASMKGSENNDLFITDEGKTLTNHAGGINGGITNGNDIVFRVSVKPTSSISIPQETFNFQTGKTETLIVSGRHDACFALRVPVIVEAVTACVLADLILITK